MRLSLNLALAFSCGIPSNSFSPTVSTMQSCRAIHFKPRLWAATEDAENPAGKVTPTKAKKATKATKAKASKAAKPKELVSKESDAEKPAKKTSSKIKKSTKATSKKKGTTSKTKATAKKDEITDTAAPQEVFLEDELTGRRGFSLTGAMLQSEGSKVNMPKDPSTEAPRGKPSRPMQPLRGYSLAQMALRAEQPKAALQLPAPTFPEKSFKKTAQSLPQHYSLTGSILQGEGSKFGRQSTRAQTNPLQAQHSTGMDWLGQTTTFVPAYKLKEQEQSNETGVESTSSEESKSS